MATFSVNITNGNSPVTVTSTNGTVSYQTLQNSLGSFVYILQDLYFQSQTAEQQVQPFLMKTFDEDGTTLTTTAYTDFSLFQKIPVSQTYFTEGDVVFDGFTTMSFTVLPSENINMVFDVKQAGFSDRLNQKSRASNEKPLDTEAKEVVKIDYKKDKIKIDYKDILAIELIAGVVYFLIKKD